jgi:hypothetical protein
MCRHHHIRVYVFIIVSLVEDFSSGGGAAIIPVVVTAIIHP